MTAINADVSRAITASRSFRQAIFGATASILLNNFATKYIVQIEVDYKESFLTSGLNTSRLF